MFDNNVHESCSMMTHAAQTNALVRMVCACLNKMMETARRHGSN